MLSSDGEEWTLNVPDNFSVGDISESTILEKSFEAVAIVSKSDNKTLHISDSLPVTMQIDIYAKATDLGVSVSGKWASLVDAARIEFTKRFSGHRDANGQPVKFPRVPKVEYASDRNREYFKASILDHETHPAATIQVGGKGTTDATMLLFSQKELARANGRVIKGATIEGNVKNNQLTISAIEAHSRDTKDHTPRKSINSRPPSRK